MLGKRIGYPYCTDHSVVVLASPSYTSDMSVLVPPMSKPIVFSNPHSWPMWRLAIAPAAIPEAASRTAQRSAVSGVITPPPECRITKSPSYPPERSSLSRSRT